MYCPGSVARSSVMLMLSSWANIRPPTGSLIQFCANARWLYQPAGMFDMLELAMRRAFSSASQVALGVSHFVCTSRFSLSVRKVRSSTTSAY